MAMIKIEHLKKAYPNVTPLKDVSTEIHKGDVISIKDTNGNSVGIIYWENIDSKNDYVAPCDGEFTIYYKVHEDGGRSVWVGEPTVLTGNFGGLH